MRISDWSSDVCSSDLLPAAGVGARIAPNALPLHLCAPALAGAFGFCRSGGGRPPRAIIANRPFLQPPCPALPWSPTLCPTPTARRTSPHASATSQPPSGSAARGLLAARYLTLSPNTPTAHH